jgi:lipopolysaccharide/colanic/teichoic acid biosynthesis glycosyltransferase
LNTLRIKRVFDSSLALAALVLASPALVVAAIGIKLTSPGPILYRARRIGRDRRRQQRGGPYRGREFTMYKLRTMHVASGATALPITAWNDDRVFPWGRFLRKTKLDEIPQLVNVILGDMSLVGPRPEAPEVVHDYYRDVDVTTLRVRPGVTSPGTLYYYTHCEAQLSADEVMDTYVGRVLPLKLDLDRVYLADASLRYDVRLLARTAGVVVRRLLGFRRFSDPPELLKVTTLKGRH